MDSCHFGHTELNCERVFFRIFFNGPCHLSASNLSPVYVHFEILCTRTRKISKGQSIDKMKKKTLQQKLN